MTSIAAAPPPYFFCLVLFSLSSPPFCNPSKSGLRLSTPFLPPFLIFLLILFILLLDSFPLLLLFCAGTPHATQSRERCRCDTLTNLVGYPSKACPNLKLFLSYCHTHTHTHIPFPISSSFIFFSFLFLPFWNLQIKGKEKRKDSIPLSPTRDTFLKHGIIYQLTHLRQATASIGTGVSIRATTREIIHNRPHHLWSAASLDSPIRLHLENTHSWAE